MQIILLMAQASGDFPDIPGVQGSGGGPKPRSKFNPLGKFETQLSNCSLHKSQLGSSLKFQNAELRGVLITHWPSEKNIHVWVNTHLL